ncbi:hypothetical protein [Couchioplanes azureus]|uniref:hypothetical protein n=1 Tax=Couchioplanes caeruleus TaxID=56438 RepID=UPI001670A008|nr:hypothetical protein [Couchioplanes caeruleus]GGQ59859.1 hypothetical protein GCM10010166_31820 [Couchioplanes caeruleus subsp. azureus]
MAETDRELGFRKPAPRLGGQSAPGRPSGGPTGPAGSGGFAGGPAPVRPSGGFVGLLHGVLTNARMLVHALALIYPFILLVAALTGSPQILAVMATSMVTLFVWALRRVRREDVNRRDADGS